MEYRLSRIAALCGGKLLNRDLTICEVTVDSRNFTYGDNSLMVALKGRRHDGHDYLEAAYAHGIRSFMVERLPESLHDDAGYVVVGDALEALQRLASDYRSKFKGTIIAVTGSTDKTLVKEWAVQSAPPEKRVFGSPKSYNSQLGVALSLLMIQGNEDAVVIEAGISHPGDMERLERMIRPEIGIFTNIGEQHSRNFESLAAKVAEKMILMRGCKAIIYDAGIEPVARAVEASGIERKIDCRQYDDPEFHMRDTSSLRSARMATALWAFMGDDIERIRKRVRELRPSAMRMELKEGINDSTLLNDSSNTGLNSLATALDALVKIASGRKCTLVISDNAARRDDAQAYLARVEQLAIREHIDTIICIGPQMADFAARIDSITTRYYTTPDEFLAGLYPEDFSSRAVLIKCAATPEYERMSHLLERHSHTSVLEVNLGAMRHNLGYYRSLMAPSTKMMAMVKASAYGNGRHEIANILQNEGVDMLAVAFADEGNTLRRRGITLPIVVLNADTNSFAQMVADRLEPEIYSFVSLRDFVEAVRHADSYHYPIHIKIDSGMHRLGFEERDLPQLLAELEKQSLYVRVSSIFTHLAAADDPSQDDFTRSQIALFDRLSSRIAASLNYRVMRHAAASAAIERFPEAHFDMCRLGIGLYGFDYRRNKALVPISTLKARVVQIKHLAADQTVGYGRAGRLSRPSVTATVSIGYADGLNRHLGCGNWSVLIHGRPAPIVGRICMDCCMVDITDIPDVGEGDEVMIFSTEPGNRADDMADILGTIPYEIMTSVSTRVKRIFINE